jgi:Flp pilus assembly protein TadD
MPNDARAVRTLSRAYVDLAAYFEGSGDQAQATFSYKQALAVDPSNRRALRKLDKLSPRDTLPIGPPSQEAKP